MGDIAQILGVQSTSRKEDGYSTSAVPRAVQLQQLPKDVLELIGSNDGIAMDLPTSVPAVHLHTTSEQRTAAGAATTSTKSDIHDTVVKVGNKWISSCKPARQWIWAPFASSARNDGLLLHHWVRNVEYPDYPYARFNIHLDPVTYRDDNEYRTLLNDPDWSKSETDQLLELAKRYELRWAVIYDRWIELFGFTQQAGATGMIQSSNGNVPMSDSMPPPHRNIEDLQYRYYTVAAILMQNRISYEANAEAQSLAVQSTSVAGSNSTDETSKQRTVDALLIETAAARALAATDPQFQPLIQNIGTGTSNKVVFDLQQERERRKHMEALWNRTKEEEAEEAELRKEMKQIEAQLRKMKKSGAHILAAAMNTTNTATIGASLASTASSRSPSRTSTPIHFGSIGAGSSNVDPTNLPVALDHAFASTAPIPMAGTPYLQSGRLLPPTVGSGSGINKTLKSRMDEVLYELGISSNPLPTKRVCDLYDAVRKDILTLLILQKDVLQKDGLLASMRMRLGKKSGKSKVDDEEALFGILPFKTPTPTGQSSSSAGKGSRGTKVGKTEGKSKKKASSAPKPGNNAQPGVSGETKKVIVTTAQNSEKQLTVLSSTKQPRKPAASGAKRKRKSDDSGPKALASSTLPSVASNAAVPLSITSHDVAAKESIPRMDTTSKTGIVTGAATAVATIATAAEPSSGSNLTDVKPPGKKRVKKTTT
jgi:DNA methyltransferase 1-associated protein 1